MRIRYGLVGNTLAHSWSVPLHKSLGNPAYALYEMERQAFVALLQSRCFLGLNVTVPYKRLARDLCDELSPVARRCGSVNTVCPTKDGRLWGDNTDYAGFAFLLQEAGVTLQGKRVGILGTGGAAHTVRAFARDHGAVAVEMLTRAQIACGNVYTRLAGCEILVQATPVGMYPQIEALPVDPARLPALEFVGDLVYNPLRTSLQQQAEALGIPACGGLGMLAAQAAQAHTIFTGEEVCAAQVRRLEQALRSQKQTIVLIGMPGCGKSAVAKALAEKTGRPLFDTDELLQAQTGIPCATMLPALGEERFRELEAACIREVSQHTGSIIATGGGAVLREDNIRALSKNGLLVWLQRELSQLSLIGRPLSATPELVQTMYAARKNLYQTAAQATVQNNGTIAQAVDEILALPALHT